jgi:hypothetical protein
MQSCQVCGRSFDPLGFQVVVPELGRGFDRIECAQSARASAGPAAKVAAVPLVAVTGPVAAAALAPAALAAAPRALAPAGAFGLLAAGTAAAVVLWVGVLGADTSSFSLGPFSPPPAFGNERVQAEVAPQSSPPAPAPSPPAEQPATVPVEETVFAPSVPTLSAAVVVAQRATSRTPTRAKPTRFGATTSTGKGHAKRGRGHDRPSGARGSGHGKGNGGAATKANHSKSKGKGQH